MPIEGREEGYPFPGARTHIWLPMPANAFQPKEWGDNATWEPTDGSVHDLDADFIAAGILPGDPIFIVDTAGGLTFASFVNFIPTATLLKMIDVFPGADELNTVYKVGEAALHTLETMATIIGQRAISAYTIHFLQLWCDAQRRAFNRDETGEVYVIDPEGKPGGGHFRMNGKDYEAAAVADWTAEDWAAELGKEIIP